MPQGERASLTAISGYELVRKLGESPHAMSYQASSRKDPGHPLVLKLLRSANLTEARKSHIRLKIEQLKVLDSRGVILPLSFEERADSHYMTSDYFDGVTLDEWAKNRFAGGVVLCDFFEIACRMAQVLDEVHKAGIIHGGIKPHNILVRADPLDVRVIDFITPLDVRDVSHFIYDRAFVEGTLAYTSPEQTGRINHRVDFTTDLYSLGIVFYELLTGRLPFQSTDPLALVHSHLAEEAPPVHQLNATIPSLLSEIVAKLTLKQPEKRYQSGIGLHADLTHCHEQYRTTGSIQPIPLGRDDHSHRVVFVSKMVGRDRETAVILDEYDRSSAGAFRCILISGLPGIGKTRLIQELQRPIVKRRGYFTFGKFDVYQKNIPYSSVIQALRNLVRTFLTESDERVARWRERILAAIGDNGRVITDVVPELVALIGPQPEVAPLPPVESRTRFHDLFGRFLSSLASDEHPLTIFIDDLQWCDADSFDFLANIFANYLDHPYLLLLGAYRSNEVDSSHALSKLKRNISDRHGPLIEIGLGPLAPEHCHEMVSYILDSPLSQTEALSGFIATLTEGNPLFASESLSYLYNEELLYLDDFHCWRWDMDRIRRSEMPSTVVALFSSKVRRLPPTTVDALEYCACMGNTFSPEDLALSRAIPLRHTFETLKPALGMGLLMENKNQLQFIHDRVQEAVLAEIDPERRRDVHWRIGTHLLSRIPPGVALSDVHELFTIASHLNLGCPTNPDSATAYRLSEIDFSAGNKALNSLAAEAANEFYRRSLSLLPTDCWDIQYERTFQIVQKLAKTELMVGRYESSEKLLDTLLDHARTDLDRAEALAEQTTSLSSIGNFVKAIETANRGLAIFGKMIPTEGAEAEKKRESLAERIRTTQGNIWEKILNMPFTTDRRSKIELAFYSELIPDLYMSGLVPQLYLSAAQSTEHCLQGGMDESVIYSFSIMGLYHGEKLEFEQAIRYEDLARNLSDKYPNTFGATRGMNGVVWCNMHSRSHPEEVVQYCLRSIRCGRNCGDLYNAGLSYGPLMWNLQVQGADLDSVDEYARECLQFSQKYQLRFSVGLAEAVMAGWIAPMRGEPAPVAIEERLEQWRRESHIASAGSYHVLRAASHYFNGEYVEAGQHIEEVYSYLNGLTDNVLKREWHILRMLNAIKLHERADRYATDAELMAYARPDYERVVTWAGLGPTLRPYLAFAEAERARARGEMSNARNLLMDAILLAHEQRYALLEGHLNECMGRLLEESGHGTFAMWLREAARIYARCGARTKLQRLLSEHPESVEPETAGKPSAEVDTSVRGVLPPLDFEYLKRSTIAMAGESDALRLLDKIMTSVLEVSGAQHAYLAIEESGRLVICAESHASERGVVRSDRCLLDDATDVCQSIVRYVYRTGEHVMLADAIEEGPFRNNSDVQRLRPRSLLCLPLTKQPNLYGVLYLENRLSSSVFTEERTQLIDLLSSQAAISMMNSRLQAEREDAMRKLGESNEYLSKLLDHANAPILACNPAGQITRFNGAFERLTGYASSEIVGRELSLLFPESNREQSLAAVERASGSDDGESVELQIVTKDGGERTLLWSSANVCADDGTTQLATVAQGQDITDRKRLTAELLQLQKIEGLGELASGIAHDFNNVLCGIMGYTDLALMRIGTDHPVHSYLRDISQISDRGSKIVRRLLAFARRQIPHPTVVNLNCVITDFLQLLRKTIEESIAIVFEPEPQLLSVSADRVQMEQVLMNLCENARDAMPRGGTILIHTENVILGPRCHRVHPVAKPGTYVAVAVADGGVGMDPVTVQRMWEPFFTSKEPGKGTGLGLSVVHGIVAQHKGFTTVDSRVGRGTRIVVYLPAETGLTAGVTESVPTGVAAGRGETILVVDDDEGIREATSAMLHDLGYRVVTASDGEEGLRLFEEQASVIRLVISDVVMPRMSGWELFEGVRKLRTDVGFLFISGYAVTALSPPTAANDTAECLSKPFTAADLSRRVRDVIDRIS
ncbi:MAG: AAA family ATPase [Acidobacteria bacterium]|nr:AAA family ATPase [Acidobacteriota bacterium]